MIHMKQRSMALVLSATLFAACGSAPPATSDVEQQAAPATTAAESYNAAPPEPAAPDGELRIGTGVSIPSSLLVSQGTNGYTMITYGAGETLMRFTPEQELVPWLATSITRLAPTTWRVVLRDDVMFHDGSAMTASDVAASFQSSWTNLAGAKSFLSEETTIDVVDATTLTFMTPEPAGNLPYSLANWNFVIHKPAVNDSSVLTGMYRPVTLEVDQQVVFEQFADYWDGAAPFQRIVVKRIPDANARALALQSGDLDVLTNVAPDIARGLPADIEQTSVLGTRLHHIILNQTRPPFDDQRVREAASSGINRDALLQATLDGQGVVATNIYPPSTGIEVLAAQSVDTTKAAALLDAAGWRVDADGIRERDGQQLAFTLHSYPGRPELTQMAVAIQAQLKPLGFAVEIKEVADIVEAMEDGDFQAAMFSIGVSSDAQYMPGITLTEGAAYNYGGYASPAIEALVTQLRAEDDTAKRQQLATQIQEVVKADTPNIYLVIPPLITAYRAGAMAAYVPHPNDLYLITSGLRKE